jgi:hypothetical protein
MARESVTHGPCVAVRRRGMLEPDPKRSEAENPEGRLGRADLMGEVDEDLFGPFRSTKSGVTAIGSAAEGKLDRLEPRSQPAGVLFRLDALT